MGAREVRGPAQPALSPVKRAGAGRLAVIITARNEAETIGGVIREARRLHPDELIVVLNGCTDGTLAVVRACPGVTILHYPEPLGHDVGRAAGAAAADADILLFLDGDLALPAHKLAPFVEAVRRGADVALNGLDRHLGPFNRWDDVTRMKAFLNRALGRPDLGAASMTAVPHALSRRALERIGTAALAVPPKAQALAIASGLDVRIGGSVDVIRRNRLREANTGRANPVSRLIVGDHLEALRAVMDRTGPRLGVPDASRRRDAARRDSPCATG
ncbi:glycosyltransferase [Thermobacillus sp. ZCTH02-B1]|uniref:glycosyltransferase family 2 protein n=1 Tax=Thermobacillus sp. ZCTH02-B1 TaxID=1858795 RepID=UPI0025FB0DB1|nr:glycosyltransferase [Thermobacillus sp. ZCTH02-B1]